jgi:DNA-binding GntR family transcriptional regulator
LASTQAIAPPSAKSKGSRSEENGPIYEAIRESILTGRYAPGERLIETRLAAEFGVSRTRIRDALARLHTEQLVSPAPNRGLVVRPLSSRDIEEIYALRLLLEGFAANVAATNITIRELDELRESHNRMSELAHSIDEFSENNRLPKIRSVTDLNNEFHQLIQRASRNSRLQALLHTIVSVPLVFQSFYWYSGRELTESCAEHGEIIRALEEHDGSRAEQLMKRHITRGLNTLLREMANS